jgi:hypothetical protein
VVLSVYNKCLKCVSLRKTKVNEIDREVSIYLNIFQMDPKIVTAGNKIADRLPKQTHYEKLIFLGPHKNK